MNTILISLLIILTLGVAVLLYLTLKSNSKKTDENKDLEEIANLKIEISSLKDTLNSTINSSLGAMSTSLIIFQLGLLKI